MKQRITTPWKKSRTFGAIYGGRERRKMADNIFARAHSIKRPSKDDKLPILTQDNPSRDYYFPISAMEAKSALDLLPASDVNGITHIWLRRNQQNKYGLALAEFVCGSGVRAVILYPWRRDGRLYLGRNKPLNREAAEYMRYCATILQEQEAWYVHFAELFLRRFYLKCLLLHEVGHHVDWYKRHWSKGNVKKMEEFADQYAVIWGKNLDTMVVKPD